MKVLIIDHQAVVREGLKRIVSEALGLVHFAEAKDPQGAIKLIRETKWDLVVLDFPFPTSLGLDFLKQISDARIEAPVLALVSDPEELNAKWALRAGVSGFVSKNAGVEEIVTAARKVVAGQRYMSPGAVEKITWDLVKETGGPPHRTLSQRELEVLWMIASGKMVTEIAKELGLSVETISSHRARILEKTGLRNTPQLMLYALEHKLTGK